MVWTARPGLGPSLCAIGFVVCQELSSGLNRKARVRAATARQHRTSARHQIAQLSAVGLTSAASCPMDGSFEDIDASDASVSGGGSAASDTERAPPGDDGQDEDPNTDDAGKRGPQSQAADFVIAESLVTGTSSGRATPHHWLRGMREVGREAVWSLSGAKPGNGVSYLLDDNVRSPIACGTCMCLLYLSRACDAQTDSYWQSDGAQPHTITVQFHRRTEVSAIALFLNHTADESYTPEVVNIRAGTTFHDLREVTRVAVPTLNPH